MTAPPPITQDGDSVTIRGAPLLAAAYRATLAGIARRCRDGLPAGDLQALARALRRAHTEADVATATQRCGPHDRRAIVKRPGRERLAQRQRGSRPPSGVPPTGPADGRRAG